MQTILAAVKAYIDKQVELANGDTTAVSNLLNALIGTSDKAAELKDQKTVRTISAEEVAKIVANAPEAYDTLKEIADWIGSGDVANTTAAQMLADIKANATAINTLKETAVTSTSTDGPVTVTLGGKVGAPTVTAAVTMATAAEAQTLADMFAITQ